MKKYKPEDVVLFNNDYNYNVAATISMKVNNDIDMFIVSSVRGYAPFDTEIIVNAKKIYEACQKQTAKKPPKHDVTVCPTCNSKWNYGHPYTKYCCHCGQAIDWKEDNE